MKRRTFLTAPALLAGRSARAEAPLLERVRSLCRDYTSGFISPATELAYGKRINGPQGIAVLESVEEVAKGRVHGEPRPYGYGSGIEDLAYQNGMLLYALCDAEEATGEPYFAEMARRAARGLHRMTKLSAVEGFVPRGPHPADGKTYYRDSSLDQHSLFVCGLWRYYRSRLSSAQDKEWIGPFAVSVLRRMEKNQWAFLVEDGSGPSRAGGSMLPMRSTPAALLLAMLAIAHDLSGDSRWKRHYDRFSSEEGGKRWKLFEEKIDPDRGQRHNNFINQDALRTETLRRLEPDPKRKTLLQRRIARVTAEALSCPYFHCFKRTWLMSEAWDATVDDNVANAYLKPLGLDVFRQLTVPDIWRGFRQDIQSPEMIYGIRNRYEPMLLAVPAMLWQMSFLSREPRLVRQAQQGVREMLDRVDFSRIDLGWAYNYAVTAALWSLAQPAAPPTAKQSN